MRLDVYVNYAGVCEEAFHVYEQHLGGKITFLARHGDQPGNPNIPRGLGAEGAPCASRRRRDRC